MSNYTIEVPDDCGWHPSPYVQGMDPQQFRSVIIKDDCGKEHSFTIPVGVAALLDYALQQREMWEKTAKNYESVIDRMTKSYSELKTKHSIRMHIWEQVGFDPFERAREKRVDEIMYNLHKATREEMEEALAYYKSIYRPELQVWGGDENVRRWIEGLKERINQVSKNK